MDSRPKLIEISSRDIKDRSEELMADYVAVKARLFLPEYKAPCDIFYPAPVGPEQTPSLERMLAVGEPFTQDLHQVLTKEEISEVYIRREKEDAFQTYINIVVQRIAHSPHVPSEKKTQALYDSAENIVRRVFEEHPSRANIQAGRQLVKNFATHISSDKITPDALFSLFSKDYYTLTHSVQVAFLGMSFCRFLGWTQEEIADFGLGALFHDIGKNAIEDTILNKPGDLDKDEFEIVKKHTLLGYQQLRSAQVISKDQLTVVLHHHEAMDGSGYLGLKDYEIHKYARVGRIIDVFDALTTRRSYKDALPPRKALDVMVAEMRETFDPQLLKAFCRFLGIEKARQEPAPPREEKINIQMGYPVILQSDDGTLRFKSILVGMDHGEFLILRVLDPESHLKPPAEGQAMSGRYVVSGMPYRFDCSVLGFMANPVQLLVLSYPKTTENICLRKDSRMSCVLPAELGIREERYAGVVMDMSIGGCTLVVKNPINHGGSQNMLDETITLRIQFLGEKKTDSIQGKVQDVKVENGKTALSIEFINLAENALENLKRCLKNLETATG